jgi:hypothetical protein
VLLFNRGHFHRSFVIYKNSTPKLNDTYQKAMKKAASYTAQDVDAVQFGSAVETLCCYFSGDTVKV